MMPHNIGRKRQKDPLQAEQMIYGNNLCAILEMIAVALRLCSVKENKTFCLLWLNLLKF